MQVQFKPTVEAVCLMRLRSVVADQNLCFVKSLQFDVNVVSNHLFPLATVRTLPSLCPGDGGGLLNLNLRRMASFLFFFLCFSTRMSNGCFVSHDVQVCEFLAALNCVCAALLCLCLDVLSLGQTSFSLSVTGLEVDLPELHCSLESPPLPP